MKSNQTPKSMQGPLGETPCLDLTQVSKDLEPDVCLSLIGWVTLSKSLSISDPRFTVSQMELILGLPYRGVLKKCAFPVASDKNVSI